MSNRTSDSSFEVTLLDGELIENLRPEEPPPLTDAELGKRYVKEGVRIVTEQARYPLNQILGMFTDTYEDQEGVKTPKYKRDPEYQRRHRWDVGRKSRLVESFLMNVPVPPVFLYEYALARFEVMDGRQRLTALMEFYDDKFQLSGLQYWQQLHGRTYSTLPSLIRDGIDRRYLSSIILLNETAGTHQQAASLKKLVFERLNSGGVRLSGQETRNAVYDGPLNDLCLELSQLHELRCILGTPASQADNFGPNSNDELESGDGSGADGEHSGVPDPTGVKVTDAGRVMYEKMDDVELVLRFFAFRHIEKFPQGLNKITEFLDEFLVRANNFPPSTIAEYRKLFIENIEFWFSVGGAGAFQVLGSNRHFSKVAFDALMYASSTLSEEDRHALRNADGKVNSALAEMYREHGSTFEGRQTNTSQARLRKQYAIEALLTALRDL